MGCGIQDAVQHNQAGFLIQLVLFLAPLGDFHHRNEVFGGNALRIDIVPNIFHSPVLSGFEKEPEDAISRFRFVEFKLLLAAEAIAAIDRTVVMGFKGNLACLTASGANGVIHLTFGAFATSVLASLTAGLTTLGFVGEALFSIKFLLTGGESEFLSAILADQSLVFVHGAKPLFNVSAAAFRRHLVHYIRFPKKSQDFPHF